MGLTRSKLGDMKILIGNRMDNTKCVAIPFFVFWQDVENVWIFGEVTVLGGLL